MEAIEIARKLGSLGQTKDACHAYTLVINEGSSGDPAAQLEAAAYILQMGGDYKISYTTFLDLYRRGHFREEILSLIDKVFYEPNLKLMKTRYERNCRLLSKYPYLFRQDFLPFEDLPIRFYPYDEHNGYVPFYKRERAFGKFINFGETVVTRNYFRDLEKPILAEDVYSQYELEYLNDNVRRSEDIGRENHLYLHYTDWAVFCSYLQCLNLRGLLEKKKIVFLIEDQVEQYPMDFQERFGIDYSHNAIRPIGIREVTRLIWHTQLSTHNGGDFFNEIFDYHPNLVVLPSIMMYNVTENVEKIRKAMEESSSLREATQKMSKWPPYLTEELYHMRGRTDKDIFVAMFLSTETAVSGMDPSSRIAPALFFQPHFHNIVYQLRANPSGRTILEAENYEEVRQSSVFRNFKYIKTFTPMRRFTTSHGATVKFMYQSAEKAEEDADKKDGKKAVVSDAVMERVLNRSFMIDPEDRLYKDSILVRFEDGKLNPKATFMALAAFLDLPYTESMTICTEGGKDAYAEGKAMGFDPVTVYRTYDEYINDEERYFIEFFLRDAYEYYGYDFQWYDDAPVDIEKAATLIAGFSTMNSYIRKTWVKVFRDRQVSKDGVRVDPEVERQVQDTLLENHIKKFNRNRLRNAKILLEGLHFVNKNGQPLRMMPKLELDPARLEQPLYH